MCCKNWKGPKLWVMVGIMAVGAGAVALAQETQNGGRIVRIGPDDGGQATPNLPPPSSPQSSQSSADVTRTAAPTHWIGLLCGPVTPELRAHVDLPEGQGLLVREVMPNSPAAKSGVKLYDIVLRANDTQLSDMPALVDLVRTEGQKQGQLTLEVLRKGQRQSITVKPEERPANVAVSPRGTNEGGQFGQLPNLEGMPELQQFFGQRGLDGIPFDFRQFGPGIVIGEDGGRGGLRGLPNMPNGVSISVQKQGDQPARVTVKRGDQSWEIVGDDPESLQQLPEDLRPMVERMLNGSAGNRFDFNLGEGVGVIQPDDMGAASLRQRMEAMERKMQELLDQSRRANQPAGSESK
jgi:hypothetical protein